MSFDNFWGFSASHPNAVAIVDAAYRSAERGGEGAAVAGFSCGT